MGNRGMGRGLAAILAVSAAEGPELREVAVDLIAPNPNQPRKQFDEESLQALAESLRERGVLQPVLVRPVLGGTFELVAGERRWRAAKLAGLERIPALVQERDDAASLEVAIIENMAREDLNPIDEARAVAALVEELGLTREDVGRRVGRSRVAVSNLLRLLDLPEEAIALIESGGLSEGHGRALLLAPDHADRRRLAQAAAEAGWSVRVTEEKARETAAKEPSAPRTPRRAPLHPDQVEAMSEISEALAAVLGAEVRVRPAGMGYRAELAFESAEEAISFAQRLRPRALA